MKQLQGQVDGYLTLLALATCPRIPWGEHKEAPCFCFQGFLPAEFEKARAIITKTCDYICIFAWCFRPRHLQHACMSLGYSGLLEGTYNKLVLILNEHGQLPDYRKVLRLLSKIQAWGEYKSSME